MKILMVCLGNICRSPIAHGLLQQKIKSEGLKWEVDSAGTSRYHLGDLPDRRSIEEMDKHGIDIRSQRSRQIGLSDLDYYDLILVMDSSNYNDVIHLSQDKNHHDKIKLILNFVNPGQNRSVPDPYYGGGFGCVYDLLNEATDRIIEMYK